MVDLIGRRIFLKKILAGGAAIGLGEAAMDRFFRTANLSWAAGKPVVGLARIKKKGMWMMPSAGPWI